MSSWNKDKIDETNDFISGVWYNINLFQQEYYIWQKVSNENLYHVRLKTVPHHYHVSFFNIIRKLEK